jgi:hypothetical protein
VRRRGKGFEKERFEAISDFYALEECLSPWNFVEISISAKGAGLL